MSEAPRGPGHRTHHDANSFIDTAKLHNQPGSGVKRDLRLPDTQRTRLLQPLLPLRFVGTPDGADFGDAHRLDAAESENGFFHGVVAGAAEVPAVNPRRGVERDDQARAAAGE